MLKALLRKSKKNQKGFTLIELLAVIVILAILAAIAIPAVMSIINHQNQKATVQDALTIINAAKLVVSDNNIGGTTTVEIDSSTATQGSSTVSSNGWSDYVKKSSGTLQMGAKVYYNPSDDTYTIQDSDLAGISAITGSTNGTGASAYTTYTETQLIDYNR
ncbi:MAG: prepilin-type N-terminal cleavage/methylation domain-containing protein [Sporolactobacillus sp.]